MTHQLKCVFLSISLICSFASAQPLADRVPDDALLYVGWRGADSMGSGFDQTHLKALLDQSRMSDFVNKFLPELAKKVIEKDQGAEVPINALLTLGRPLIKYPSAIFAGMDLSNPSSPMPKVGIICLAGKDAGAINAQLKALLAKAGEAPFPIISFDQDGLAGLLIGYDDASAAIVAADGKVKSLKASPGFGSALKQVQTEPVICAYVDIERLAAEMQTIAAASIDEHFRNVFPKVLDASGLLGLKRVIHVEGFDGTDWMTQTFAEAPAPRTGLLSVVSNAAVSAELLKAIPQDATFVATARFDPVKLINEIKSIAGKVDPNAPIMIDKGLGAATFALGKNLMNDILEPLGEDWAVYASPTIAGSGLFGIVVVNKLDDAAKAQMALPGASINVSNWINVALAQNNEEVEISGRTTKIGDSTIYYMGLPMVAPCWTIKDGYLYLGLYPQAVGTAARQAGKKGAITDNPRFSALRKRLGVDNAVTVSFYDLQHNAANGWGYEMAMFVTRLGGFADMFGVPLPEPLLPPLDVLLAHLSPAGSATWIDDAGFHSKSVTPFPGAELLSEQGAVRVLVSHAPLAMALIAPVARHAEITSRQTATMSNLRQIGQAIMVYASDTKGAYPPDLKTLVEKGFLEEWALFSPMGHGESDYEYFGISTVKVTQIKEPSQTPLAYDARGFDTGNETAVLFVDGHVEWMTREAFNTALQFARDSGLNVKD